MEIEKYLTQEEMLEYLDNIGIKKSKSWAEHARFNKRGPKFVRFGGHIRTTKKYIDEWVESCVKEVANND
jgi:hypothetical protein